MIVVRNSCNLTNPFYLMKKLKSFLIFIFLILFCSPGWSQMLTAGYYGGVNFSDIHGGNGEGKWKYKPGPVQGLYLDYSFNRILGFRTGVNYSTINYERVNIYQGSEYYPLGYSSSFWPWPYYSGNELSDFSFLTIPAQIRLSVPSVPRLDLMAGIYDAFLIDHSGSYYSGAYQPSKEDFGYIYSMGLSFPLADKLEATINARYTTGRNRMNNYDFEWHGSMDFTFGVAWNGILKNKNDKVRYQNQDSVSEKIYLIYKGGVNASWNSGEKNYDKYSLNIGPSLGLLVNFRLSPTVSFQTGVSFDRTGYSLKDSSDSFNRYLITDDAYYYVDTKTSVDYLTIPLLINFQIGDQGRFYINTGPYAGIKLNARCKGTVFYNSAGQGSYNRYKRTINDDLESAIKDNDFGWLIGGGMSIPIFKRFTVDLGLQYRRGFGEVFERSYLPEYDAFLSRETVFENSSVSFQIGLRVPVLRY